jgi:hypothetical protein
LIDPTKLLDTLMTAILSVICFTIGVRYLIQPKVELKRFWLYPKTENYTERSVKILGYFFIFVGIFAILLWIYEVALH